MEWTVYDRDTETESYAATAVEVTQIIVRGTAIAFLVYRSLKINEKLTKKSL